MVFAPIKGETGNIMHKVAAVAAAGLTVAALGAGVQDASAQEAPTPPPSAASKVVTRAIGAGASERVTTMPDGTIENERTYPMPGCQPSSFGDSCQTIVTVWETPGKPAAPPAGERAGRWLVKSWGQKLGAKMFRAYGWSHRGSYTYNGTRMQSWVHACDES